MRFCTRLTSPRLSLARLSLVRRSGARLSRLRMMCLVPFAIATLAMLGPGSTTAVAQECGTLRIGGSCPGPIVAVAQQMTPGAEVVFLFSPNQGSVIIPNTFRCAGTQLGLGSPVHIVGRTHADNTGLAELEGVAPPAACGGYMQAVDMRACCTTFVLQLRR